MDKETQPQWPSEWKQEESPEFPVVCRIDRDEDSIHYEVRVSFFGSGFEEGENEQCVWSNTVYFGRDPAHHVGGAAFIYASKEQDRIAEEWVNAITKAKEA